MDEACSPRRGDRPGAGWLSGRSDRDAAASRCAGGRMIGSVADGLYGHLGYGRPIATKTSVECKIPAVAREGAHLQFTAFDASYLERLQGGDLRTEQHFAAYFGELIALKLRSRLNSKEAIEDVRQETFVRVLALVRAKDGIRQPERLGALVNSVCNHVLLEHYRAHHTKTWSVDAESDRAFIGERITVSRLSEAHQPHRLAPNIFNT